MLCSLNQYEELLKDIEEARAKRIQAQMFLAQAMSTPPQSGEEPTNGEMKMPPAPEAPKRTLKRQD